MRPSTGLFTTATPPCRLLWRWRARMMRALTDITATGSPASSTSTGCDRPRKRSKWQPFVRCGRLAKVNQGLRNRATTIQSVKGARGPTSQPSLRRSFAFEPEPGLRSGIQTTTPKASSSILFSTILELSLQLLGSSVVSILCSALPYHGGWLVDGVYGYRFQLVFWRL